jgi:hypothetical protein
MTTTARRQAAGRERAGRLTCRPAARSWSAGPRGGLRRAARRAMPTRSLRNSGFGPGGGAGREAASSAEGQQGEGRTQGEGGAAHPQQAQARRRPRQHAGRAAPGALDQSRAAGAAQAQERSSSKRGRQPQEQQKRTTAAGASRGRATQAAWLPLTAASLQWFCLSNCSERRRICTLFEMSGRGAKPPPP